MSFWTNPTVAAKNAVDAPAILINTNVFGEYSKSGENLITKNTPAVHLVVYLIRNLNFSNDWNKTLLVT